MNLSNFFSSMIRCKTWVLISRWNVCLSDPAFFFSTVATSEVNSYDVGEVRHKGCLYIQVVSHKINAKLTTLLPPPPPRQKKHHLTGYDRFWWKSQHQPFPLTSRWFSQSFNSISCCIHVDQRDLRTRGDFASHRPPEVRWRCAGNQFAIRGYHDIQARLKWPSIRVSLCWVATSRYNMLFKIWENNMFGKFRTFFCNVLQMGWFVEVKFQDMEC